MLLLVTKLNIRCLPPPPHILTPPSWEKIKFRKPSFWVSPRKAAFSYFIQKHGLCKGAANGMQKESSRNQFISESFSLSANIHADKSIHEFHIYFIFRIFFSLKNLLFFLRQKVNPAKLHTRQTLKVTIINWKCKIIKFDLFYFIFQIILVYTQHVHLNMSHETLLASIHRTSSWSSDSEKDPGFH